MIGFEALELARKYEGVEVKPTSFVKDVYFFFKNNILTCSNNIDYCVSLLSEEWEIHKCPHKKSHYENSDGEHHCVICGVWQSSTNLEPSKPKDKKPDTYPLFKPVEPGHYNIVQSINGINTSKQLYFDGTNWMNEKPVPCDEKKEKPKLVTWYRPKLIWLDGKEYPQRPNDLKFYRLRTDCYLNRNELQRTFKVLEWDIIEAPETWEQCE